MLETIALIVFVIILTFAITARLILHALKQDRKQREYNIARRLRLCSGCGRIVCKCRQEESGS